jgi:CcmD family protein
MSYLFAAYAVFWALTFAYVFRTASRQKQLERELQALRRELERQEQSSHAEHPAPTDLDGPTATVSRDPHIRA